MTSAEMYRIMDQVLAGEDVHGDFADKFRQEVEEAARYGYELELPHEYAHGDYSDVTANVFCPTGVGGGIDPTCSPHVAHLENAIANITEHTGYTREQLKNGLGTDKKMRAKVTGSLLHSGMAIENAVRHVKLGDPERVKAITIGNPKEALTQFEQVPAHDLAILKSLHQHVGPVKGEATANRVTLQINTGQGTRPGSFRHELGHIVRFAMSGDDASTKNATTKAIYKEFQKVKEKVAANPEGLKKKMPHEWYEKKYGCVGRRCLDNWEENFAEHYRVHLREKYRDEHGDSGALDGYRERHPGMAKIFDAHYTTALIHQHLNGE